VRWRTVMYLRRDIQPPNSFDRLQFPNPLQSLISDRGQRFEICYCIFGESNPSHRGLSTFNHQLQAFHSHMISQKFAYTLPFATIVISTVDGPLFHEGYLLDQWSILFRHIREKWHNRLNVSAKTEGSIAVNNMRRLLVNFSIHGHN
jgi:hypothetical protein